jgi:hypothetical protein
MKSEPPQQPQKGEQPSFQPERKPGAMSLHSYRTPQRLSDLENEPAYKRRNIQLGNTPPHSSESALSRYTLSNEPDDGSMIRKNNTFLHDNVD